MDIYLTGRSKTKLNGLAYYQIGGGIFGIAVTIWSVFGESELSGLQFLLFLVALCLYSFSMYCGRQLLIRQVKSGLRLSTINQVLQSINFAILGYAFKYTAGFLFFLGIDFTNDLKFKFFFSLSTFQFNINFDKQELTVGLNLVAIFVIYLIQKLQDQIENSRQEDDLSESTTLDGELLINNSKTEKDKIR
jgi:hypothetical protein